MGAENSPMLIVDIGWCSVGGGRSAIKYLSFRLVTNICWHTWPSEASGYNAVQKWLKCAKNAEYVLCLGFSTSRPDRFVLAVFFLKFFFLGLCRHDIGIGRICMSLWPRGDLSFPRFEIHFLCCEIYIDYLNYWYNIFPQ